MIDYTIYDGNEIGIGLFIGHYALIRGGNKIGEKVSIGSYTEVSHDCVIGNNVILVNSTTLAGHVSIGDFAILGGLSAVHQFVNIGQHAMIGGGSLVRKDVPPYVKAAKEPISYVGINSVGLRRRGFSNEKIAELQKIYRLLFQSKFNNSQAIEVIETEMEASPERDEVVQFVRNSPRGIMKGFNLSRYGA
jgi:UDP-N-acetylglucosamine acyltransferase